jgi:hypothetical protein
MLPRASAPFRIAWIIAKFREAGRLQAARRREEDVTVSPNQPCTASSTRVAMTSARRVRSVGRRSAPTQTPFLIPAPDEPVAARPRLPILASQGLTVSRQGLGCMGMSEFYGRGDEVQNKRVVEGRFGRAMQSGAGPAAYRERISREDRRLRADR